MRVGPGGELINGKCGGLRERRRRTSLSIFGQLNPFMIFCILLLSYYPPTIVRQTTVFILNTKRYLQRIVSRGPYIQAVELTNVRAWPGIFALGAGDWLLELQLTRRAGRAGVESTEELTGRRSRAIAAIVEASSVRGVGLATGAGRGGNAGVG